MFTFGYPDIDQYFFIRKGQNFGDYYEGQYLGMADILRFCTSEPEPIDE